MTSAATREVTVQATIMHQIPVRLRVILDLRNSRVNAIHNGVRFHDAVVREGNRHLLVNVEIELDEARDLYNVRAWRLDNKTLDVVVVKAATGVDVEQLFTTVLPSWAR